MKNWKYRPQSAIDWWDSLSIDEKIDYKKRFEVYRTQENVVKMNFPNMYDLRHIRISQLSEKHIIRIFVFKDRI